MTDLTAQDLRTTDLIAKTARVTLKDTMRVLMALELVANATGQSADTVLSFLAYDTERAGPEQVAACERAFYALIEAANQDIALAGKFDRMEALK